MKRKRLVFQIFVILALMARSVSAEVPGHNPEYDSICRLGEQYSRKIVGCAQANCPAGASRTDELHCNCGEVWGKPFKTCKKGYLAATCTTAGGTCPTYTENLAPLKDIIPPSHPILEGHVTSLHGDVFIFLAKEQQWVGPIKKGFELRSGDVIRTDASRTRIELPGPTNTVINIGHSSLFQIDSTNQETESWTTTLMRGVLRIRRAIEQRLRSLGSDDRLIGATTMANKSFSVKTPSLRTTAIGTDFVVTYNQKTKAEIVYLFEGQIVSQNIRTKNNWELKPGQKLTVVSRKPTITQMSKGEWEATLQLAE